MVQRLKRLHSLAAFAGGLVLTAAIEAQPPPDGIPTRPFALHEMDLHLHAGMERQSPLHEWIDTAVRDGRRVIVLLDHLELYRKTPKAYEAWLAEKHFPAWYPPGTPGHTALFADFDWARAARPDVVLFRGWEISEEELDTGIEEAPMRRAEVIGWHISPHHVGAPPDGAKLIRRIRQIKAVQERFSIPMILFHPFTMRIENLQRRATAGGRDLATLTVAEYRFFKDGQQEEVASLLRGSQVYLEMASASRKYFEDPIVRAALIADIKPLADLGVQFTVSSDNHSPKDAEKRFNPEDYCAPVGITPENTNAIVRELMARRAALAKPR